MITLFPFVYRKVLPLGSPPNTRGIPLCVLGKVAKIVPKDKKCPTCI